VNLMAVGEVTTYREAYSYSFDCYRVRYCAASRSGETPNHISVAFCGLAA
jgi:hypothetical protein